MASSRRQRSPDRKRPDGRRLGTLSVESTAATAVQHARRGRRPGSAGRPRRARPSVRRPTGRPTRWPRRRGRGRTRAGRAGSRARSARPHLARRTSADHQGGPPVRARRLGVRPGTSPMAPVTPSIRTVAAVDLAPPPARRRAPTPAPPTTDEPAPPRTGSSAGSPPCSPSASTSTRCGCASASSCSPSSAASASCSTARCGWPSSSGPTRPALGPHRRRGRSSSPGSRCCCTAGLPVPRRSARRPRPARRARRRPVAATPGAAPRGIGPGLVRRPVARRVLDRRARGRPGGVAPGPAAAAPGPTAVDPRSPRRSGWPSSSPPSAPSSTRRTAAGCTPSSGSAPPPWSAASGCSSACSWVGPGGSSSRPCCSPAPASSPVRRRGSASPRLRWSATSTCTSATALGRRWHRAEHVVIGTVDVHDRRRPERAAHRRCPGRDR